jgi:hypothetical protein
LVEVCVTDTAPAYTGGYLERIQITTIVTVRGTVTVRVCVRDAAPADAGDYLRRVAGALIARVSEVIVVRVLLSWIRDTRAIVTHIPNTITISVGLSRIPKSGAIVLSSRDAVVVNGLAQVKESRRQH